VRPGRWAASSCLLAALALGVSACGDDDGGGGGAAPEGGETQLDLTIGDIIPLTGDLSPFGPPGRKAADLAVEEINSAAEEVGAQHTVEIQHADEETNEQATVNAGRALTGDGATCLAGAWASADTLAVARSVTTREGVLEISPASTSDEITELEDDGLLSRTAPPDSFQGPALAQYMSDELGGAEGTTVNIGNREDAYGTGLAESFTAAWEELGGTVGETVSYDPALPSFNSEASQIVSGEPDAVVIIDFPETYAKVGPALVRTGDFDASQAFVTDGLISDTLADDAGDEAVEGLRGTAPGVEDEAEAAQAFDQAYSQAEPQNVERQTFDAQNFDATILCYLSAVAAGSTEGADMAEQVAGVSGPGGTQYTFEELPQAVEALQNGEDIDYQGASGPIDLNESGDPTAGVYDIFEFQDGAPEEIDEVPIEGEAAGGGGG
jgi:ABC-type branched-subunit amino acid transport system substrate-binding protein